MEKNIPNKKPGKSRMNIFPTMFRSKSKSNLAKSHPNGGRRMQGSNTLLKNWESLSSIRFSFSSNAGRASRASQKKKEKKLKRVKRVFSNYSSVDLPPDVLGEDEEEEFDEFATVTTPSDAESLGSPEIFNQIGNQDIDRFSSLEKEKDQTRSQPQRQMLHIDPGRALLELNCQAEATALLSLILALTRRTQQKAKYGNEKTEIGVKSLSANLLHPRRRTRFESLQSSMSISMNMIDIRGEEGTIAASTRYQPKRKTQAETSVKVIESEVVISKLHIVSVLRSMGFELPATVIVSDLLWRTSQIEEKRDARLDSYVSDLHLCMRYFFHLANDSTVSLFSYVFQLFNSSQSGIMTLGEVNHMLAYYCSLTIDNVIQFKPALELFSRYLKTSFSLENFNFYMELYPYVNDAENNGMIPLTKATYLFRNFLAKNSMEEVNVSEECRDGVKHTLDVISRKLKEQNVSSSDGNIHSKSDSLVNSNVFLPAYKEVRKYMEAKNLAYFLKKIKQNYKLGKKVFIKYSLRPEFSGDRSPIGMDFGTFSELLNSHSPLQRYCQQCRTLMVEVQKSCKEASDASAPQSIEDFYHFKLRTAA